MESDIKTLLKKQIGERLKNLRLSIHLSQSELAEKIGTQQSTINRYEHGQSIPVAEIFIKYADYFGVSMDYLYCRTDDPMGESYNYHPEALRYKSKNSKEVYALLDMCFDPQSVMNVRLKKALYDLLMEDYSK
jgi:transcriptional regulator with XRE-family HTH domain